MVVTVIQYLASVSRRPSGRRARPVFRELCVRLGVAAAVSVTTLVVGSGCSAQAEPDADLSRAISSYSEIAFPLDAYGLSSEGLRLEGLARDLLVGDCMAEYGLHWQPPTEDAIDEPQYERRYGILDPELAQRYGYRPSWLGLTGPKEDAGLTQAQMKVYVGCASAASAVLAQGVPSVSGSGSEGESLVLRLSEEAFRLNSPTRSNS